MVIAPEGKSYGLFIQKSIKKATPKIDDGSFTVLASFFFKRGLSSSLTGIIQAYSYHTYNELISAAYKSHKAFSGQESKTEPKQKLLIWSLTKS